MTEPDAPTMNAMAEAAMGRAALWELCGDIAVSPTPEFVERLRTGEVIEQIGANTRWLGDDTPFDDLLGALRAFANRSSRFSAEDDLASLTEQWQRLGPPDSVPGTIAELAGAARDEAAAWTEGDHADAKQQRLKQFESLNAELETLGDWCQRLDLDTDVLVTRVLARIVAAHLSVESGRDLLGSLERTSGTATFTFA